MKQSIHLPRTRKTEEAPYIRHAKALEEVKRELSGSGETRHFADRSLSLVDSIQRLGIRYHFEEEIEATLQRNHLMLTTHHCYQGNDYHQLSQVALQFRLFRQEGYYVNEDVFDKFWDKNGKVKRTLCKDIKGLIALFEASQLRIEGEDCLEEAGEFSRQYLSAWVSRFHDHPQAKLVANTLQCPIHKSLSRFMATSLDLENPGQWTNSLQELYKLDTQIVRSTHLEEIFAVSKWWKELGLARDSKFARAEPIKWYMWPMACIPDPCLSEERIEITKPLSLIYIIDDIFDCHGSIDELTLFTDAVNSWDLAAMEQLPDYMKLCFKALYDITNEVAFKTLIKHGWNPIGTLIKSWVRLLNAFLEEAKWFASGHLPTTEEYLKNGIISTGAHVIFVHAFFIMGKGITNETVTLMDEDGIPSLISTTATIVRLCDDLEGNKKVTDNDKDGSYLKCYMKDHPGVSIEQTRDHISHQISVAWKQLNRECLKPTNPLPSSFAKLCLNSARMIPLMYSYDNNSPSKLEEYVTSLFYGHGNVEINQEDQSLVS
ncbi:hypothetical protein RIF29_36034 [Crotalaria pallida]|uniref:Uncharacterized protein n=1 Tax=Crotalaria pallida TaxID=3830 RepID=A0AAN9EH08_CROPI